MSHELEKDFTLEEVADALGMSTRWVRQQCKDGAVHNRYGRKIRFTAVQVDMLKKSKTKAPVAQGITSGRGKRSA